MKAVVIVTALIALLGSPAAAVAEPSSSSIASTQLVDSESLNARTGAIAALRKRGEPEPSQARKATIDEQKNPTPSFGRSALKVAQGLVLCVGVFLIGIYGYRKLVLKNLGLDERRIRILERVEIAPKTHAVLLDVEGQKMMLTVGSSRVTHLPFQSTRKDRGESNIKLLCKEDEVAYSHS